MRLHETAERRQVTILHCDIVNSTVIVDSLDPEDVLSLMEATLANWTAIIKEFRGTFVGYTGDGFQAYFGYPYAHEDAAVDALSAALEVSRMFAAQDDEIQKELECRIGVATGQVVIGQPDHDEQFGRVLLAFGSTPCLAARMEQAANPGHILIDDATRRLTTGRFVFREVGTIPAKGFKHDVEAWQVVRKRLPGPRFDASQLSRYVGRQRELEILHSKWQSMAAGEGQVVVVHGDPGIGKSRLIFEFEQSLGGSIGRSFQFQCSSLNTSTPLHPWIHWVQRFANIQQQDDADTVHSKLYEALHDRLGLGADDVASMEAIMGLSHAGAGAPDQPPPQKMLMALQEALVDNLISAARDTMLFVLLEDVHWIDASTQAMLQLLVERVRTEKIFLMLTSRPEKVPSFDWPHVTYLPLTKLDRDAVSELVAAFNADEDGVVDDAALLSTIEKCDGNPLFVEEISKYYLEQKSPVSLGGDPVSGDDHVPVLLQGSLLERIDTAGKGKEIAQLASVIGPEFDRDIIMQLSDAGSDDIQQSLDELVGLNILSRNAFNDRVFYAFRHALLRDAVYSSLLHSVRSAVHRKVGTLLAGERQTYSAEVIARHFETAGDRDSAFVYWLEAGQHALQSGATEEAVSLLASAVNNAPDADETPHRLHDLTSMYLAYGHALNASGGAAAEPITYYRKAEELAVRMEDTELTLEALDWQFGVLFNAGELAASTEPAGKLKQLGLAVDDPAVLTSGYQASGMVHFMRGEFTDACDELQQGIEVAGDYVSGKHCFPSMSLSYLAWTYFVLGLPQKARSCAGQAIASARNESPHAIATALSNCSYVYQCIGAIDMVYACADELHEHAQKHGELMYVNRCIMTRSWADCMSGCEDNSLDAIKEHIGHLLASSEEVEITYHLGVLADLQIRREQYADANVTLDKALMFAGKNQEEFYVPELYRLKAVVRESGPDELMLDDDTNYIAMAEKLAASQSAEAWLDRLSQEAPETVN